MSDKVTETFTSEDDVRYALIRVLLSNLTKGQECHCRLPARCILCLAMISLGFEAWPNDYRAWNSLRQVLGPVRTRSGLWRSQMSELADHMRTFVEFNLEHDPKRLASAAPWRWILAISDVSIGDVPDGYAVDPEPQWPRGLVEDKDGPGETDRRGLVLAPPGWRLETDDEIRSRVKQMGEQSTLEQEQRLKLQYPDSFRTEETA